MLDKKHIEIEARFLEIDKPALIKKLRALKAKDLGQELLQEIIFYGKQRTNKWWVRLRKHSDKIVLSYKNRPQATIDGTEEVEFKVSDFEKSKIFLEKIGLVAVRVQEKRRHSFKLGTVTIDIDVWPKVPPLVELEGPSEAALKKSARDIGLAWREAHFEGPRKLIETHYGIPVGNLSHFTFKKIQ